MKTFQEHLTRVKRPLRHVKKVRHVKWLLPGWVFYEYYKLNKNKIEKGEIENLTLKAFRDFTPIKRLKINKEELIGKNPYLKIAPKGKRLYFKIFYRRK